jgi:hypothetical protein
MTFAKSRRGLHRAILKKETSHEWSLPIACARDGLVDVDDALLDHWNSRRLKLMTISPHWREVMVGAAVTEVVALTICTSVPISIFEVEEPPVVPVWFVGADDDQPCAVSTVKVSPTGRLAAMMPKTAPEAFGRRAASEARRTRATRRRDAHINR